MTAESTAQIYTLYPDTEIEPRPEKNSSFSSILPTLQLAWDSTSLGEFKICARRYYYTIIRGYTSRTESIHTKFGRDFHSALEVYDHLRADNVDHSRALIEAVRTALTSTWDEKLNRPWNSEDPNKNRDSLIRSVIAYCDNFENDTLETIILGNNRAAVELSFRFYIEKQTTVTEINCPGCKGIGEFDLGETCTTCSGSGKIPEQFIFCGHIDRLVRFQDKLWISDRKTTKNTLNSSYFAAYSPDNQISLYSYAGRIVFKEEIAGAIIDAAQILVDTTEFRRGIIERKEEILEEWINDAFYYISLAEVAAERNHWPMNDKACGRVYEDPVTGEINYGCPFRPVCANHSPEMRQTLLDTNYTKRIWDPLKPR